MEITDSLFIIPARGGSKGLPRKNILPLAGKPLIYYTIDAAMELTTDDNICVSSDDPEIIQLVENYGVKVSFVRPNELANDTASSWDVLIHAIDHYEKKLERIYKKIILLQPTSPLRNSKHIFEAYSLWKENIDMIVSVKESKANPYFNLFEEDDNGFLKKSKNGDFIRRQDAPKVWEYNGAIYIINIQSIKKYNTFTDFNHIVKYPMNEYQSIDIDTKLDWQFLELLINNQ